MKLSSEQVKRVEERIDGQVVPVSHPLSPELQCEFGDHIFFLNPDGLNHRERSAVDRQVDEVVKLAGWTNSPHTELESDVPEPTPVAIQLES